jgi:hypothetical protein
MRHSENFGRFRHAASRLDEIGRDDPSVYSVIWYFLINDEWHNPIFEDLLHYPPIQHFVFHHYTHWRIQRVAWLGSHLLIEKKQKPGTTYIVL